MSNPTLPGWPAPRPSKRRQLTPERLVQAALQVLQADGFEGLTMRRLAEQLEVKAASLYNHVEDKDEVLALAADAICGEMKLEATKGGWREQLEGSAREIRRVLLSHRDGARVLAATPPTGPNRLRMIEQMLTVLVEAGFPDSEVADVSFVVSSTLIGFVLDEAMGAQLAQGAKAQQKKAMERWFKQLPKDRYPNFVRLAGAFAGSDPAKRFELAVGTLLDGLELRLERR